MTGEDRVMECLKEVGSALRQGRLGDLENLTASLEAALADTGPIAPESLLRIRHQAVRNAALLQAAARGVRAARRRIAEIRAIGEGFVSYGPTGERDEASGPGILTQRV